MTMTHGLRTAVAMLLAASACSSGGGHDPQPPLDGPPALPAGQPFTLSGAVTYEFVPATYVPATRTGTLAFGAASARPVRGARLQVRQGSAGTVLAETATGADGRYTITFTPGPSGALQVAALAETVSPSIRVEDNTDGNAVWAVGQLVDDARPERNLHAPHGWNGTSYVAANRIAAPFAILDSMYTAARRLLDLPRDVPFPPLKVNWSPNNAPEDGNKAAGQIGTSHYSPGEGEIYILGLAGVDTDEFDSHVIVHEWGHYFEDKLSRADSPGGAHGPGDVLDPRLAFGEGYGNAIAAMLLPESIYADTLWSPPGSTTIAAFGFDAETVPNPTDDFARAPDGALSPGPFSEMSVLRVLYDLYDTRTGDDDAASNIGLGPIYDTLVGPQKATQALTTIASFVTGFRAHPDLSAAQRAGIDAVLASFGIGPISDEWGTGDADLRAMYRDVPSLQSPFPDGITFDGGFEGNKWQAVRFWVVTGTGRQIVATASSPDGVDVDLHAYRSGTLVAVANSAAASETIRFASVNGAKYVIVLSGWGLSVQGGYDVALSVTSP